MIKNIDSKLKHHPPSTEREVPLNMSDLDENDYAKNSYSVYVSQMKLFIGEIIKSTLSIYFSKYILFHI